MDARGDAATVPSSMAARVRHELARVLASPEFSRAQSHQRLLRHLVERTLAGDAASLKESVLGIEVFYRPAGRFDPREDSIVRVEARRLRQRLLRHYGGGPRGGEVTIELPTGSYHPRFVQRASPAAGGPRSDATELLDRGLFFLRLGHEEGHRKALQRFEAAARLAPELAGAHSGVARAWVQLVATNLEPPQPGIDIALAAVHRGLALEPQHPESLVLAAQLTHRFAFDWPAARALFDRAVAAAPALAYVRGALALSLMMRGEFDEAEASMAAARQLDPLHLALRAHTGLLHLYRRDWERAEIELQALLDLSPDNVLGLSLLAYVELCRGNGAAAETLYRRVATLHPQLSIGSAGMAQALAAQGRADEARSVLETLRSQWPGRYLSPYQIAMVELRLGEIDAAVQWLTRAIDERDPNAVCLPVDPVFDVADPRIAALASKVL